MSGIERNDVMLTAGEALALIGGSIPGSSLPAR
jgi:hypothetical protein